ncbi:DUF1631 domain-containing protein [Methylocaldum sp.]|uniref:DUF1631 domain-containing protein n=1 Tax=Methylocaldum sp. TaxID=1969727 RepID=UPI002D293F8D|nr:DUF1631 domain-containing protein [Methylocaldum sp.]HYE35972.1 DUF1631 domain-containing protein [Methylocaldum sp.]
MAMQDLKIINFEMAHAKQKESAKGVANQIITRSRELCSRHLSELMQQFSGIVDDELFQLSDKAENMTLQSQYFEAMRYVRLEWNSVKTQYIQHVLKRYDEFWRNKSRLFSSGTNDKDNSFEAEAFSLVENEILEEQLAVSAMIEKGNNLFQGDLHVLNKRFGVLSNDKEVQTQDNPVAPHTLCYAFSDALRPLKLDLATKLLIYKLFDRAVVSSFGGLYYELNTLLINEGILPKIINSIKRSPTSPLTSPKPVGSSSRGHSIPGSPSTPEADNQVYFEVFLTMQSLLEGWRSQLGLPTSFTHTFGNGPAFETAEVLSALNVLQAPSTGSALAAGNQVSADQLKHYVANQLRALHHNNEGRPMGRLEEDIIDMVGMIFDFILEDRNLSDPVKTLIARLQIPVIKVAILEKSFFGRKNHPVRLLLNNLAQAGLGLEIADATSANPVFQKIETIVSRILNEFAQDIGLFSELLDDFTAFLDRENQRNGIAEERTRQVTQSKEQLLLTKRKVAYEIAVRLQGKAVPAAARSFLYNTWKDVLVLAHLRRDKQPGDWDEALALVDQVILSVLPPADNSARQEIAGAVPSLIESIRAKLEGLSLDPAQVSTALKEIEKCHASCLRSSEPKLPIAFRNEDPTPPESIEENQPIQILDPEISKAIIDIRGNLPDIQNFSFEDLHRTPKTHVRTGEDDEIIDTASLRKATDLAVGEWIEFIDHRNKTCRGKLSWKSQLTSTCVFVNRKGVKVAEISISELAKRLNNNTARIIEGSAIPLMDRALITLINTLKNPTGHKATAPA